MRRLLVLVATLGMVLASGTAIQAQVAHDDPSTEGTTGLFMMPRASTYEQGSWAIGGYLQRISREEGDSYVETLGFSGGYGLSERVELFVGFSPRIKIDRRFTAEEALFALHPNLCCTGINEHPFATDRDHSGFGDVWAGAKYKFVGDPYEYDGLALQGVVKFPTSATDDGIGAGAFSIGGKLIGSVEAFDLIGWNGYVGYTYHDSPDLARKLESTGPRVRTSAAGDSLAIVLPTPYNFFVSPELTYGVGFHLPSRGQIQAVFEWMGWVTTRDMRSAFTGGTDQSMVQFGLRASLDSGLFVNAAANYQTDIKVRDSSWQPTDISGDIRRWGFLVGAGYSNSRKDPISYAGTSPMDLPALNSAPTLSCRAERSTIRQGESVRIMATTSDPDGDPVTVTWNAAAGSLSARTGDTVTWSSRGVPAGSGNIAGRADDGYGGTADCTVRVSVQAPPAPAQATVLTFSCAEFGSGSARIDNRCKAVLDDVALQLRQNPGATAAVTGHSDSAGSADVNNQMAQERADNAKAYLVDTHGVDPSRISTASRGFSEPAADNSTAAGRSLNRRIEIVVTIPPR